MNVYFDNAATTPVCREAVAAMTDVMTGEYGNPSSTHYMGRRAKSVLDGARKQIAAAMGASPEEIYFTSGGTEANNWAVFGAANLMRHKGKHIICALTEHDSLRRPVEYLAQNGYDVTWLAPDKSGRISAEDFADALREDTVFASVMLVNNETGAVNPIPEIAKIIKARKSQAVFHTDAVQGFFRVPFTSASLGADLISVSGHKIHGPKGIGALWIKKPLRLPQHSFGGSQENGRRAGTEALPAIAGFAAAAEAEKTAGAADYIRSLRGYTAELIAKNLPGAQLIGQGDAPHILSISLPGYRSEVIMNCLDADGICVSKSSACKKGGRSHTLEAMRLPPEVIDGAIRISFSRFNTRDEAEYFAQRLLAATERLIKT